MSIILMSIIHRISIVPLLACRSLVATGGSTNTRRHRLTGLLARTTVAVVAVARADSSSFTQIARDVAYSRSAAVVLLAPSPCICLRAALSSRLAD